MTVPLNSATRPLIAAAIALAARRRDAIRQVALERGCLIVDESGDEFATPPGLGGRYPLSDLAVLGHAREHLELVGHVVDPKTIAETWLALGDGAIEVDEALVAWLDTEAASAYARPSV